MEYVERMSSTSPTRAETDSKVLLAAAAASASRSPSETGMPQLATSSVWLRRAKPPTKETATRMTARNTRSSPWLVA